MKNIAVFLLFITISVLGFTQNPKRGEALSQEVLGVKVFDLAGNELTISEVLRKYEGKILYLDFWASWCAPCRNEIPYSKILKKKFEQNEIAFLYFSTDESNEPWKKSVDKLDLHEDSYRLDKDTKIAIQKFFNIKGIPYYLILDRAGNIYENNASWPREENAASELEKALKIN